MTDEVRAEDSSAVAKATFGGGCFWCLEAVYSKLEGVKSVAPGYAGGTILNPTYEQVCTGNTGHAEVIQINFDLQKTSYETLLEWFWRCHDPTTLNRQGPNVGYQYRSEIFYTTKEERISAQKVLDEVNKKLNDKVVTVIRLSLIHI